MYGDPDRQVANIINQNSENAVQSAPRIAVYITDLELDVNRIGDSSYVGKVHIRERAFDQDAGYLNTQGNNYTVERLMPTPYNLTVKVDIWSSSNDQKLQILEQILMLFNPSLEIQTSDNYVDWTSLSVVNLAGVTFSSRTVPVGSATEIDIATISLTTPIWISPPAKVKRLGVVTSVISNILSNIGSSYGDYIEGLGVDPMAASQEPSNVIATRIDTPSMYDIDIEDGSVLLSNTTVTWEAVVGKYPGEYRAGLSRIYLKQPDGTHVVGLFSLNPLDSSALSVAWDEDTYPSNTVIASADRSSTTTFDAIIDPKKTGPNDSKLPVLVAGSRYLIVDNIGGGTRESFITDAAIQRINTDVLYNKVIDEYTKVYVDGVPVTFSVPIPDNVDTGNYYIVLDFAAPADSEITYELYLNQEGPIAWKNSDGSDFIASENDIIEWNGDSWNIVFEAETSSNELVYLKNIFTGTQYKWNGVSWGKSFEGHYRKGAWYIEL
jgi:hypothetical protein